MAKFRQVCSTRTWEAEDALEEELKLGGGSFPAPPEPQVDRDRFPSAILTSCWLATAEAFSM
jgi:hypothetical protein